MVATIHGPKLLSQIYSKLDFCSKHLLRWNVKKTRLTRKDLDEKVVELSVLQNQPKPNLLAIKQVEREIALGWKRMTLNGNKESRQTGVNWVIKAPKFFHTCALQRLRSNRIHSIENCKG